MKPPYRSMLPSLLLALAAAASFAQPAPQPPPPARVSEAEAIAALKAEVEKRVAADQFSGAVLIARNGKPIFEQAYGYADREKKIPNTLDTKFRFGSMGKMFTGVAVTQLVQAGKIKLNDPLSKYLTDYPNKDVGKATIHQLLTHTGGTGNIFGPELDAHRAELKEHSDYVKLFGERGTQFEPGSKWDYSNYGMVLLGRVIEAVSGQNYYDYIIDHTFKPTDMKSTGNEPENTKIPGLSINYTKGGMGAPPAPGQQGQVPTGPWKPGADTLPYRGTSAGGGYSTVGDFLKFANALTANKLLDAKHSELLLAGKAQTPRGVKYAYGFEDALTQDGVRRVGHGGGAPGMNGMLMIYPASQYTVVMLANFDPPAAEDLAGFVSHRLPLNK